MDHLVSLDYPNISQADIFRQLLIIINMGDKNRKVLEILPVIGYICYKTHLEDCELKL